MGGDRRLLVRRVNRNGVFPVLRNWQTATDENATQYKHNMKIEIAKNPSIPTHSVLVDGLWDCDCASNSEAETLNAAHEKYPDSFVIMWDDSAHYSQN
jgi:hypothetical protein